MDILAWGVLPPVLLLIYIYRLDKVEREPVKLVVKALLFGCLCCIPAALIEELGIAVLDAIIPYGFAYNVLMYFVIVAIAEEGCKRKAMKLAVWKNSEFNYLFDAVLYMVAVALGFALLENVEYMALYGTGIALGRLIPVHTICGVFMGISLGAAKNCECLGDKKGVKREYRMSLVIPVLIHGAYDYGVSTENGLFSVIALVMVCVLTVVAFLKVKETAKNDRPFYGVLGQLSANTIATQVASRSMPPKPPVPSQDSNRTNFTR